MALATFTPIDDRPDLSILRKAKGHPITVNISRRNYARVVLLLSDEDYARFGDWRHVTAKITVTDLMTGIEHRLTGADCGLGCRCAVTFA